MGAKGSRSAASVLSIFPLLAVICSDALGETINLGGQGTFHTAVFRQAGLTVTPEVNVPLLNLLNFNGLGVVGGTHETTLDPGESVFFQFSTPATGVSYSVQFGSDGDTDGTFAEASVEGYGADGSLLGVGSVGSLGTKDVSGLFGNAPLSAFRVHTRDNDRQRISGVSFNRLPGAPVPITPSGITPDSTPTYSWEAVDNATSYRLLVNDSTGPRIDQTYTAEEAGCVGGTGTCSITPTTILALGAGTWQVQATNAFGSSPWTELQEFTVVPATVSLTVSRTGSATGTVTSNPAGVNCGSTCSASFPYGTAVSLTATPAAGAVFREWRGACAGTSPICILGLTGDTSVTAVFGQAFSDDPVAVRSTLVKAAHVTELRQAVNALRSRFRLVPASWTDPTLTVRGASVKTQHITELRTALNEAYKAAGQTSPTYTDPTLTPRATLIKASHVSELRAAVRGLE